MQKSIFDVTVVDVKEENIIFYAREVASTVKEATEKVMKTADEQKLLQPEIHYHIHVIHIGLLPGTGSGLVVPNQAMAKSIIEGH